LGNAWRQEVITAQQKAREKYTGQFRTYEESIPHLREEFPLLFTHCFFTKHWYSRNIEMAFSPASDEVAYKMASAWLEDCLAK
jgi:hypothetical protein